MRFLEELQMNALPSLQTVLYDGWIIRYADGYSNRANSVNPIYKSDEDVYKKIAVCEEMFRTKGLKPTYKITPFVNPENLDEILESKGCKIIHITSVQTLDLIDLYETDTIAGIKHDDLNDEWFETYCAFNNLSDGQGKIYRRMLSNLVQKSFFSSMYFGNEIIACGMAVIENGYIGLFDITVREDLRNKGYGRQLLYAIMNHGKEQGAKKAYLQVMTDNKPACHLYNKLGFKEEYQYYYRVKFE